MSSNPNKIISLQELINAQIDAYKLELIMNEAPWVEVTTRLGRKCYSIATIQGIIDQYISKANIELLGLQHAIDTALAAGAGEAGWAASLVVDKNGENQQQINDRIYQSSILGRAGISVITGDANDAHYGWGGIVSFGGKWVHICRKAASHGTLDNAQLVALDSYDKGQTWINERVVLESSTHDLRPDPPKLMASNRGGLIVNRASVANGHFSPIFLYSDDSGVTWKQKTIETESGYTFSSTGGFLEFPSSVGGADNTGFIAYGFLSAGGLDALYTLDNGETWQQKQEVATISGDLKALSEWSGCRLGSTDRWIFTVRSTLLSTNTWNQKLTVFTTNNPLDWGVATQSTFGLGGNPPCIIYDDKTDTVNLLNISRGGRAVPGMPENCIAYAQIDAEAAYSTQLVLPNEKYKVLTSLPHWATGYLASMRIGSSYYASLTCGEAGFNGGGNSIKVLIGDFVASTSDTLKLVQHMNNQLKTAQFLELTSYGDNSTYPLRIYNKARDSYALIKHDYVDFFNKDGSLIEINANTAFKFKNSLLLGGLSASVADKIPIQAGVQGATLPAAYTIVNSSAARNHYVFHNANGLVGSISTSGTSTTYATTSDETLKNFDSVYDAKKAIDIIKADPVRNYTWKRSGEKAIGWGAQTSYAVDKTLAVKGGWYLGDVEVPEGTEGATYVAWGMDYSKRVPYLWAVIANLLERIEKLENNSQ